VARRRWREALVGEVPRPELGRWSGARKHGQAPGEPLEGSMGAMVAGTWRPTVIQSSSERRIGGGGERGSEQAGQAN
jgi:hypothetical protein